MGLIAYTAGLTGATILAGACLAAILIYFDPFAATKVVFGLFYSAVFIACAGGFSLIGFLARRLSQKKASVSQMTRQFEVSFRQGLLLSFVLLAALLLQAQRALAWWHLPVIVGVVAAAEWWLSRK